MKSTMRNVIALIVLCSGVSLSMATKKNDDVNFISHRVLCDRYVQLTNKVLQTADTRGIGLKEAYRIAIPQQNEGVVVYFATMMRNVKADSSVRNPDELLLGVCIEHFYGQRLNN